MSDYLQLDRKLLQEAIDQSQASVDIGGYPVGALLAKGSAIASYGLSNGKQDADPTAHAETTAIRALSATLNRRSLKGYTLYTSMAPCLMCYGAAFWAGITRVVYAVRKEHLSWQHFEGSYNLHSINQQIRRPIELVHIEDLEPAGLSIISAWELNHPVSEKTSDTPGAGSSA
jgi:tRNA(Arg) A34 adenosine deaminase TadA